MNFTTVVRGALIAFLAFFPEFVFADTSVSLPGHLPVKHLARATDLGQSNLDSKLDLAIFLSPRNLPGIQSFLSHVYDPKDPLFHQFLTPEQFTAKFSPTQSDFDQVTNYLSGLGFEIIEQHKNRMVIDVRAPASLVQNAFQVEFHDYISKDGHVARSPASNPVVPESISKKLSAIIGLHNFSYRKFHARTAKVQPLDVPSAVNNYMTPTRINSVYNVSASGQDGTGETIALFELDGYTTSDVTTYASSFSLPTPQLQNVLVDSASGTPSTGTDSGAGEVTLDIELALALAPKSKILIYEGPIQGTISNLSPDKEIIDIYTKIANDNLAKTVSTSWGSAENEADSATLASENAIFLQMATQGQSFFAASGDSGAYDDSNSGNTTTLAVDDPASQPYVTGVGGTTLSWSGNTYASETSWGASGSTREGGGGGISSHWSQPTYQSGFSTTANKGSSTMRMVPDVSLDANPSTGYPIYYGGTWVLYGGTSCAAPLWAAYTALVNEGRVAGGKSRVGFLNPTLYSIAGTSAYASDFHDLSDGSTNLYYPTTTGYDLSSGLGSFNGGNLFTTLTGTNTTPTPTPTATPAPVGGVTPTPTPTSNPWPTPVPGIPSPPTNFSVEVIQ